MYASRAPLWVLSSLLAGCSGEKVETGEGEDEVETGDSTPGEKVETGETGGEETGEETGEVEHGKPRFFGYFVVGEQQDDWTCLNYFEAEGEYFRDATLCPACDFGLDIRSEYHAGAMDELYPECAWEDLSSWALGETFETTWAFAADLQLAYYRYAGSWYAFAEYAVGTTPDGEEYMTWNFIYAEEDAGARELGLFWGYLGSSW